MKKTLKLIKRRLRQCLMTLALFQKYVCRDNRTFKELQKNVMRH